MFTFLRYREKKHHTIVPLANSMLRKILTKSILRRPSRLLMAFCQLAASGLRLLQHRENPHLCQRLAVSSCSVFYPLVLPKHQMFLGMTDDDNDHGGEYESQTLPLKTLLVRSLNTFCRTLVLFRFLASISPLIAGFDDTKAVVFDNIVAICVAVNELAWQSDTQQTS